MKQTKKALTLLLALLLFAGAIGFGSAAAETPADARVSYLGPAGTYTEEATRFFFPAAASYLPEATVNDAIADLVEGRADYAVIPQENTLGGAVTNYVDALIAEERVFVAGEVILPISQTLMGVPGATLEDIKTVCSHAQGITQSAAWRAEHLPDAVTEEMSSTAAAASYVAERQDKSIAAVAAPAATYTHAVFVADCEANRIDDILVEIHETGLELVTLHDRPEGSALGHYYYIIEVEDPDGLSEEELLRIGGIEGVRCLGSFDAFEKS